MIGQILERTPGWVFMLFFALLYLGYLQSNTRKVPGVILAALPIAMIGLSFYGAWSGLGGNVIGIGFWGLGIALAVLLNRMLKYPRGVIYSTAERVFTVPGSRVPLALMMGVFFTRYVATVALARNPSLIDVAIFVGVVGLGYGLLSGWFLARALHSWSARRRLDE